MGQSLRALAPSREVSWSEEGLTLRREDAKSVCANARYSRVRSNAASICQMTIEPRSAIDSAPSRSRTVRTSSPLSFNRDEVPARGPGSASVEVESRAASAGSRLNESRNRTGKHEKAREHRRPQDSAACNQL